MKYATAIDQIMGYWGIFMCKQVHNLHTIVTPFGKYKYKKLPMGLKIAADVFQQEITKLMDGIEGAFIYIDNPLLITKGTFKEHLTAIRQVLKRMQTKDLQVNIDKPHFAVTEVEYLGYDLDRESVRPQARKVQSILDMTKPKTAKELRGFIGLVNFYCDLFRGRAHHIAPLSEMLKGVKRGPVKWNKEAEAAFTKVKE